MIYRQFLISIFVLLSMSWHQLAISQFAPAIMIEQEGAPGENATKRLLEEVVIRERAFLAGVCDLSEEQKTKADIVSTDMKAEAVKKAGAAAQAANRPPQMQIMIRVGDDHIPIEKTTISKFRKSLHSKYQTLLTQEQQQVYQEELKARDEFARRANAECLVTILDLRLALEPDQIEPLRQSLMNWTEADDLQLTYYLQENAQGYMPPIPVKYYVKLLTPAQRKILDAAQKVSVNRHQVMMDVAW